MKVIFATLLMLLSTPALAGAYQEYNIKMHCAILKDSKVVHQQNCIAEEGYVHAGAGYGGGAGYSFKPIKGYGKISVDSSISYVFDTNDNPVYDKDGHNKTEESTTMNGKKAIINYRTPKTFKPLTKQQINQFYEGKLKYEPYTCFIHTKNPKFEFCFSKPLM